MGTDYLINTLKNVLQHSIITNVKNATLILCQPHGEEIFTVWGMDIIFIYALSNCAKIEVIVGSLPKV